MQRSLAALIAETGANELMVVSDIYDHAARLRSFELIAAAERAAGLARDRRDSAVA